MKKQLAVLFCAASLCSIAQAQPETLKQGTPILAENALESVKLGDTPVSLIDVQGQNFARALHVQVPQTAGESNAIQITLDNKAPVAKGDALLATFAARGTAEIGAAQMMFLFERNRDPWTKSVTQGVSLPIDGSWRRVAIPFTSQEDYAPGEVMSSLRLAFGAQTLDIANVQVFDFGQKLSVAQLQVLAAQMSPIGNVKLQIAPQEKRQIMLGLGGNYTGGWRAGGSEPNDRVAQYTRANLNPAHARLALSLQLWQPDENGEFHADGKNAGVLKMAQEFSEIGVPLTLSIWEVPDWMSEQQGGKKIIPEAKWDATINALASFLVRARDEYKAPIGTVSFNEADWGVDVYFTPQTMAAFIKRAVPEFQKRGLKTLWLAGDTSNGGSFANWTRPQLEDEALRPLLGPVAFHSWDALNASDATYREIADIAQQYNRDVWCLEAGSDAQAWQLKPTVWPTWNYALQLAQSYIKTIGVARASLLDYWTYRNDYSLVSGEDKPYPSFQILQQMGEAFGKGTQIIGASSDNVGVQTLAGVKPDGTTVVFIVNPNGAGEATISGLKAGAQATMTLSDENAQNRVMPGKLSVDNAGELKVQLPLRSVLLVELR